MEFIAHIRLQPLLSDSQSIKFDIFAYVSKPSVIL